MLDFYIILDEKCCHPLIEINFTKDWMDNDAFLLKIYFSFFTNSPKKYSKIVVLFLIMSVITY